MQSEKNINEIDFNENSFSIREELEKYLYYWKWFVLGGLISVFIAYFYLRYVPNQYKVATTILISDEKGGGMSELAAFQDLGLMGGSQTSIDNEIILLKSRDLIGDVIKNLGVNVSYYHTGRVANREVFYQSLPFKINFLKKDSLFYTKQSTFIISIKSNNKFELLDMEGGLISKNKFGDIVASGVGDMQVLLKDNMKSTENIDIVVKIASLKNTITNYGSRIQIASLNKNSDVISISLVDQIKAKAELIVNELVRQYNKSTVEDKNLIAKNTNIFINKRLEIITKELLLVETGAEAFKSENKLTDITSEASLVVGSKAELEKTIVELSTQLKMLDYVHEFLQRNSEDLLPANLGLADANLNESTAAYNALIIERDRVLQSSSQLNPAIINFNSQIDNLKKSIGQSLENFKSSLNISLNQAKLQESLLNSKIAEVPRQEREYRDIIRQQQIIEALYLYLLQKREENAISLAVTQPNTRIIDKAFGYDYPVAPNRRIIYLGGLMLGVLLPFGILYIIFLLDNKIHNKKDIEAIVKAPILGDIPSTNSTNKIVVSDNDRDSVAESFRLLRTNMNFMLSNIHSTAKTIYITSTMSGEGKTFISLNMAAVLALSGKKVLLIGADIRKPKLAEYLKLKVNKGLTHFLMDSKLNPEDLIDSVDDLNFDIIHSGIIAPNPSELLMNGRFEKVLEYAKEHYDYVIVDTAPVNLVTDTLLLGDHADLFIYVVRANYLDKRLLEIPKKLYQEKRLPNMAILINGINYEKSGYGYGYGYGYGDGETEKVSWWKRIIGKS